MRWVWMLLVVACASEPRPQTMPPALIDKQDPTVDTSHHKTLEHDVSYAGPDRASAWGCGWCMPPIDCATSRARGTALGPVMLFALSVLAARRRRARRRR